jgi:hypothetical protein
MTIDKLPLARGGNFCGPAGAIGRSKAGTTLACRIDRTGHRNRWQLPVPDAAAVKPLPAAPVPLARPVPLVDGEQMLPLAAPAPPAVPPPAVTGPAPSPLVIETWQIGRNAAQHAVPLRWTYDTRQVDPDCAHLVDDPAGASKAISDYVYNKCFASGDAPERAMTPTINAALRGHTTMTAEHQHTVHMLDDLFSRSVLAEPITVWRGVSDGRHILPADWTSRDLTGVTWSDPAYTSTSGDEDYVDEYGGGYQNQHAPLRSFAMRITVPAGSSAITIWDVEDGDDEGEVLLPRGCRFRVTADRGTVGENGTRWLDVEVTQP